MASGDITNIAASANGHQITCLVEDVDLSAGNFGVNDFIVSMTTPGFDGVTPTTRAITVRAVFVSATWDGTHSTVTLNTDGYICDGDTSLTADVSAGFFNDGVVSSNAVSGGSVTNDSENDYTVPPLHADSPNQYEQASGEVDLYIYALAGIDNDIETETLGVECIEVTLTDGDENTQTVTLTEWSLRDRWNENGVHEKTPCFHARLDLAEFGDGWVTATVKAYPHRGDADSVAEITGDVITRWYNISNDGYDTAEVYVDVRADIGVDVAPDMFPRECYLAFGTSSATGIVIDDQSDSGPLVVTVLHGAPQSGETITAYIDGARRQPAYTMDLSVPTAQVLTMDRPRRVFLKGETSGAIARTFDEQLATGRCVVGVVSGTFEQDEEVTAWHDSGATARQVYKLPCADANKFTLEHYVKGGTSGAIGVILGAQATTGDLLVGVLSGSFQSGEAISEFSNKACTMAALKLNGIVYEQISATISDDPSALTATINAVEALTATTTTAASYYGSDANDGSEASPVRTLQRAGVRAAAASANGKASGSTIYVLGGAARLGPYIFADRFDCSDGAVTITRGPGVSDTRAFILGYSGAAGEQPEDALADFDANGLNVAMVRFEDIRMHTRPLQTSGSAVSTSFGTGNPTFSAPWMSSNTAYCNAVGVRFTGEGRNVSGPAKMIESGGANAFYTLVLGCRHHEVNVAFSSHHWVVDCRVVNVGGDTWASTNGANQIRVNSSALPKRGDTTHPGVWQMLDGAANNTMWCCYIYDEENAQAHGPTFHGHGDDAWSISRIGMFGNIQRGQQGEEAAQEMSGTTVGGFYAYHNIQGGTAEFDVSRDLDGEGEPIGSGLILRNPHFRNNHYRTARIADVNEAGAYWEIPAAGFHSNHIGLNQDTATNDPWPGFNNTTDNDDSWATYAGKYFSFGTHDMSPLVTGSLANSAAKRIAKYDARGTLIPSAGMALGAIQIEPARLTYARVKDDGVEEFRLAFPQEPTGITVNDTISIGGKAFTIDENGWSVELNGGGEWAATAAGTVPTSFAYTDEPTISLDDEQITADGMWVRGVEGFVAINTTPAPEPPPQGVPGSTVPLVCVNPVNEGLGDVDWQSPENACEEDGQYASAALTTTALNSRLLAITFIPEEPLNDADQIVSLTAVARGLRTGDGSARLTLLVYAPAHPDALPQTQVFDKALPTSEGNMAGTLAVALTGAQVNDGIVVYVRAHLPDTATQAAAALLDSVTLSARLAGGRVIRLRQARDLRSYLRPR